MVVKVVLGLWKNEPISSVEGALYYISENNHFIGAPTTGVVIRNFKKVSIPGRGIGGEFELEP